jgi:DNA-binding response OmpR family regulator
MNKKKILVVEDDAAFRKLYVGLLRDAGYEVAEAEDGEKGLKYAQEGNFDLVILDVMLPKLDGLAVLTELKRGTKKCNCKVIFLTNLAQESMVTQAKELGVSKVIVKTDVTPEEALEKIKSLVG